MPTLTQLGERIDNVFCFLTGNNHTENITNDNFKQTYEDIECNNFEKLVQYVRGM